MRIKQALSGGLALLISIFVTAPTARADFYNHFWLDHHQEEGVLLLSPQLGFYRTDSNYTQGQAFPINGLDQLTWSLFDTELDYGFSPQWSVYVRLSWAAAGVTLTGSTTAVATWGLADQTVGVNYRLIDLESFRMGLQLQGDFPGYNRTTLLSEGEPLLGDGTVDVSLGPLAEWPVMRDSNSTLSLNGGIALTERTDQYSRALPWSAFVQYDLHRAGWKFDLGIVGLESLGTDPNFVGVPTNREFAGGGGSDRIGAVNPSFAAVSGGVGLTLNSHVAIAASADATFWGDEAPKGLQGSLGAVFSWDGKPSATALHNPVRLTPNAYGKSNQGFVSYDSGAHIVSVDGAQRLVKIDRGGEDGVKVGQTYDVFQTQDDGSAIQAVARGKVIDVEDNGATIRIVDYFIGAENGTPAPHLIRTGYLAKQPLQ